MKILQREIGELIRVVMTSYPIDLGKFTVRSLGKLLPRFRDQLGLNFDRVVVYPGPQPRESADVELYLNDELVGKINVKTAVSGDLETALRRLKKSVKSGEDGLLVAFGIGIRGENPVETKMLMIYIPSRIIQEYTSSEILLVIEEKLAEKMKKEKLDSIDLIAFNEALQFEQAYRSLMALETAKKAKELAKQARNEAKEAKELAREARDEAREIKELVEKVLKKLETLLSRGFLSLLSIIFYKA